MLVSLCSPSRPTKALGREHGSNFETRWSPHMSRISVVQRSETPGSTLGVEGSSLELAITRGRWCGVG